MQHAIKLTFLISPFFHCHSSQFEEKFEEINGVDVAPKFPSSPEFNKHQSTVVPEDKGKDIEVQGQDGHGPSSDFTNSQDFVSGIMKIVPSDVAVSIASVCEIFVLRICREHIYCKYWHLSKSSQINCCKHEVFIIVSDLRNKSRSLGAHLKLCFPFAE